MWLWSRKFKDWRFNVNLTFSFYWQRASIKWLLAFLLLFKKKRRCKKHFTGYSIKRNFTAAVHPTFYGGTIWGDNTTTMWHHKPSPLISPAANTSTIGHAGTFHISWVILNPLTEAWDPVVRVALRSVSSVGLKPYMCRHCPSLRLALL